MKKRNRRNAKVARLDRVLSYVAPRALSDEDKAILDRAYQAALAAKAARKGGAA